MRVLWLLASLICVLDAQTPAAKVVFKPVAKYAKKQVWTVSIRSELSFPLTLTREAIMQAAPQIADYPNDLAQDILIRTAAGQAGSLIGSLWQKLSPAASAAAGGLAIAKRTNGPLYVGAAIAAIDLGVTVIAGRSIQPQKYFSEMLPSTVGLGALAGATYGIISDYRPGALPIGPLTLANNGDVISEVDLRTEKIMAAHFQAAEYMASSFR